MNHWPSFYLFQGNRPQHMPVWNGIRKLCDWYLFFSIAKHSIDLLLFHRLMTQLLKKCPLKAVSHRSLNSFWLCPLVLDSPESLNRLSVVSHILFMYLNTLIMSPLWRLYTREGNFKCLSLSSYDMWEISGISFVALLWTDSSSLIFFLVFGDHV